LTISHCLGAAITRLAQTPPTARDAQIQRLPSECRHPDCTTGMGCRDYVASLFGSEAEARRRVCEARCYLAQGHSTSGKVSALVATIATRRGQAAADQLRSDMREQWALRKTWMVGGAP
jgi:hypothetical protein